MLNPASSAYPRWFGYLNTWVNNLDKDDSNYDHNRLEALWVSWGLNKVDAPLLEALLKSDDHRVRAAVVRVIRYMGHQLNNSQDLLKIAATDKHGRVRSRSEWGGLVASDRRRPRQQLAQFEKSALPRKQSWPGVLWSEFWIHK